MTEELDSTMNQIENLEPIEANEWLRIANLRSSYPSDDPGSSVGGDDAEGCAGDPSTPSDNPPDPPDSQQGGDSYTPSD
jgi:hypothetical protein